MSAKPKDQPSLQTQIPGFLGKCRCTHPILLNNDCTLRRKGTKVRPKYCRGYLRNTNEQDEWMPVLRDYFQHLSRKVALPTDSPTMTPRTPVEVKVNVPHSSLAIAPPSTGTMRRVKLMAFVRGAAPSGRERS